MRRCCLHAGKEIANGSKLRSKDGLLDGWLCWTGAWRTSSVAPDEARAAKGPYHSRLQASITVAAAVYVESALEGHGIDAVHDDDRRRNCSQWANFSNES